MRISDWSSDVCSSDLCLLFRKPELGLQAVDLRQFIVRDDLVGQRLLDRPPELPAFCECKHAPSLLLLRCRQTQHNETAAGLALSAGAVIPPLVLLSHFADPAQHHGELVPRRLAPTDRQRTLLNSRHSY